MASSASGSTEADALPRVFYSVETMPDDPQLIYVASLLQCYSPQDFGWRAGGRDLNVSYANLGFPPARRSCLQV